MRCAIVGSGAIGSLLGHGLVRGGAEVTLLDLPPRVRQIAAMDGIVVVATDGSESCVRPSLVTSDYAEAGVQDVVILATKAYDLPDVAASIPRILSDETVVVTVQNGIPWWYLHGIEGPLGGRQIRCLDPAGALTAHIPAANIVGCVAYAAANLGADGRVLHVEGWRFPVGELDGSTRARTSRLAEALERGGFKSRVIDDIRSEIWLKALGSLSINPISALTGATMTEICSYGLTRDLVSGMMCEAKELGEALGARFRHTVEERIAGARAVGAHKTSMLQDAEAGRRLEIDALMLAILELAEMNGRAMPNLSAVYACVALLDHRLRAADAGRTTG